ncbi:MAG: hypothetical protein L3J81_00985 [Thermoplasmata archaeon]|nr:hypothetical protein [Thermoplasmata archaeon]
MSADLDAIPHPHRPRPVCEVERAYRELVGHGRAGTRDGTSACSPEIPEERSFPAPPDHGTPYTLCNGHLRDLFDEQALARTPAPPPPGAP